MPGEEETGGVDTAQEVTEAVDKENTVEGFMEEAEAMVA